MTFRFIYEGIWNWAKRAWKAIGIDNAQKKNKAIVIQVVPDGIPDHIYNFPEQYDFEDCGGRYTHVYVKNKVSGWPLIGSGGGGEERVWMGVLR